MIKKSAWYLINCVIVVAVSLKSGVYAFGKYYYESTILINNDQSRYKSKFLFLY